jgi:hypothetical protein
VERQATEAANLARLTGRRGAQGPSSGIPEMFEQ